MSSYLEFEAMDSFAFTKFDWHIMYQDSTGSIRYELVTFIFTGQSLADTSSMIIKETKNLQLILVIPDYY